MYLSTLLIDVGTNPDRPRPGRLWLRNRYRVHQRLCMAFPYPETKKNDPDFLKPYQPCAFRDPRPTYCAVDPDTESARSCTLVQKPVHVPRDGRNNFLFRVDPRTGGNAVIVVLSANKPDWDYAFHNAGHLLRCRDSREYAPAFSIGQSLRFQLVGNPTKKINTLDKASRLARIEKRHGARVPVGPNPLDWLQWLGRKALPTPDDDICPLGFRLCEVAVNHAGYIFVNRTGQSGKGQRFRSVRFEGVLEVTDSSRFTNTLVSGIGPAKAFGFGLLSIAPVR